MKIKKGIHKKLSKVKKYFSKTQVCKKPRMNPDLVQLIDKNKNEEESV
jgi:hypothetical protein